MLSSTFKIYVQKGVSVKRIFQSKEKCLSSIIINRDDTFKWKHRLLPRGYCEIAQFPISQLYNLFTARFSTVLNFGPNFVDGFTQMGFRAFSE